jgi:hypothetical protein
VSRRVTLRSAEKVSGKANVVAYKRAMTKRRGQRERLAGLSGKDAASTWLQMSPAERRALSDGDVRAMVTKARKDGMPLV